MDDAAAHRHRAPASPGAAGRAVTVMPARQTWLSFSRRRCTWPAPGSQSKVVGKLHVAEPGDGEDALQLQPTARSGRPPRRGVHEGCRWLARPGG
jgi:hypothetical protein